MPANPAIRRRADRWRAHLPVGAPATRSSIGWAGLLKLSRLNAPGATPLAGPHWHTWHEPCRRHPDAAVTWAGTLAGSQPAHFRTVSGRRPVVTAGHAGGSPGSGLPLCGPDFRWAKSGWKCVAGEEMGHVVCRNEGVRLCSSSYVLDRWFGDIPGQQREKYFVNSL